MRLKESTATKLRSTKSINKKQFFYEGHYMDDDYSIVYFGDVELRDEPIYHYYLFYDLDCGHTFHTPSKKEELDKYSLLLLKLVS